MLKTSHCQLCTACLQTAVSQIRRADLALDTMDPTRNSTRPSDSAEGPPSGGSLLNTELTAARIVRRAAITISSEQAGQLARDQLAAQREAAEQWSMQEREYSTRLATSREGFGYGTEDTPLLPGQNMYAGRDFGRGAGAGREMPNTRSLRRAPSSESNWSGTTLYDPPPDGGSDDYTESSGVGRRGQSTDRQSGSATRRNLQRPQLIRMNGGTVQVYGSDGTAAFTMTGGSAVLTRGFVRPVSDRQPVRPPSGNRNGRRGHHSDQRRRR